MPEIVSIIGTRNGRNTTQIQNKSNRLTPQTPIFSLSFGRLSPNSSLPIATAAGGYPAMTRRCSHCSNNGHNSRTCPTRSGTSTGGNGSGTKGEGGGVRLFGVRLTEGSGSMIMKKSASVGCLSHYSSMTSHGSSPNLLDSPSSDLMGDNDHDPEGYASDDPNHASCSANRRGERKKGIPWTEEEHRRFLVGLQKLGKGDWRGISRNYVVSRTPTQVASHAQKYFIRQTNASRRKRRSSLFDMVPDMPVDQVPLMEEQFLHSPPESESKNNLPPLDLSLEQDSTHAETITEKTTMELEEKTSFTSLPPLVPAFYPAYFPMVYPYWPSSVSMPTKEESTSKTHVVLKPTPVLPKDPGHADEVVGMSNLSIGEAGNSRLEPSALSSKLLSGSSARQSAFHANPAASGSDINQTNSSNPIHAV